LLEHKLNKQFAADGAQPQELARTRSFHYSYFNLQAVTLMAVLAQKEGVDVWHYQTPQGGSLVKSLDFMAPYTDDNRPWPYPSLDRISVIIVPFLSWADNALGQSRYQQQVRSASFNLPAPIVSTTNYGGGVGNIHSPYEYNTKECLGNKSQYSSRVVKDNVELPGGKVLSAEGQEIKRGFVSKIQ